MPMKPEVILRADAGPGIGLGHIRRCLALAQAFRKTGKVRVSFATQTPETVAQWVGKRFPVNVIPKRLLSQEPDWWRTFLNPGCPPLIVLDRYGLNTIYFKTLRKTGAYVALIDDEAKMKSYPLDCVINYNVHASPTLYKSRVSKTLLLTGPAYALIGKEFFRARSRYNVRTLCTTLFSGLGGFAPEQSKGRLERIIARLGLSNIRMEGRTRSVAALLSRADLAVSASGVTSYELACLGVPTVLVIVAANQAAIAKAMAKKKAAVNLGWLADVSDIKIEMAVKALMRDSPARKKLSRSARLLVDGRGAERTAAALIHTFVRRKI